MRGEDNSVSLGMHLSYHRIEFPLVERVQSRAIASKFSSGL